MLITAGILIDFGNSETRVKLLAGNKAYRFNLPNNFAELPAGYKINNKYGDGKTTIFRVGNAFYANGLIVDLEFSNTEMRPTALQSKTKQKTTELTIHLAFIKSLQILAQVYNIPVEQLDITFKVSALLPPLDHEVHEEALAEMFRSVAEVGTIVPSAINHPIKLDEEVNIYSEAVAAFFGAFYNEEGIYENKENNGKSASKGDVLVFDNGQSIVLAEVEENKKFSEGYVLVLDIGAGTTDVALFLDMELIESSKDTFKLGGNTVASNVLNIIRRDFGYAPTKSGMAEVISTGLLPEGSDKHDVAHIVTKAKEIYSSAMLEEIRQYLERMTIALPVVKGVLVAGGGALATERDGQIVSPAMSDVLHQYLKTLAPRLEALNTEGKNLRELNIDGLSTIHKYS